jgi:outer membrane protein assembly factor BamB
MPFWGPKHSEFKAPLEYGEVVRGGAAAFKVEETKGADGKPGVTLTPAWLSRDMWQADSAVVANGVVFVYGNGEDAAQSTADIGLSYNTAANRIKNSTHATLYALDAKTGAELWSSGDQITSFNHFTSLSIANGRVYIGTFDGMLYAFGVDKPAGTR